MPRRAARCAIPAIIRHRAAAVALGVFCAASAASDPLDLARELADRLAAGAGALMPAADRVQVEEERIVPLDASWPADFLAGLVAEKRFGHEVFPVYARLDNATGAAVFYDADGLAFHEIEPLVPPIDATTWLESLLGPATSPGDAWRELSHVVARFLLVPADDLEGYLADAAEDAALCARSAPRQRTSPPAVTKLTLTDISFTPTSVLVNAEWPAGSLPGNAFDLYLSQTLRKTGWQPYMAFAAPGQTNVTSFCTEIPNEDIPGWTDPATLHDASCPVATNVAVSPFDPASAYTNVHYVCGHEMPQQSCFFVAGPTTDTDGDGLTDMEEAFCFGTDHELADSDNDGLGDFEEVCEYFTDPFSPDTDGDGSSDLFEIVNGSDPRDPSDDGLPPAAWQLMTLPVRLYGDYAAWEMSVRGIQGELRTHTVVAAAPGVAEEDVLLLRRCATYRVSLRWLTSWPHVDPDWYCWEARFGNPLQPTGRTFADHSSQRLSGHETVWGEDWYCENAEGLLTTHVHTRDGTAGNVAQTKTAILHTLPEMPELAAPLAGVQCGSGRRVEMAVTERSWHPALEWEIYPTVANGPRLFATEDSTDPATFLTGPRSVWVSSGSVPGVYSILATYPDGAYSTEGHVVVPVVGLDGDFNRNGIPADNADEAAPFGFDDATGMVVPCNNDDDNEDGTPDCGDLVVNGADDLADLRKIVVRRLGFPQADLPTGAALTAEIAVTVPDGDLLTFVPASQRIRLFGSNAANAAALGGEAPSLYEGLAADLFGSTDRDLWLEGRFHGATALLTLRVRLDGEIIGEDAIRVRVAPFEVLSNCDVAEKVFVAQTAGWNVFVSDVALCLNGVVSVDLSNWTPLPFPQDVGELGWSGYSASPRQTIWSLERQCFIQLMDTQIGFFNNPTVPKMGGNIEASPPTQRHGHGRVIVGKNLPNDAKCFLSSQEIQTENGRLIELPTDWLLVGHVDEIVSIVPTPSGDFKVFLADLKLAIDLICAQLDELEEDLATNPNDLSAATLHANLAEKISPYLAAQNETSVSAITNKLLEIRNTLKTEIGLSDADCVSIPVLYPLKGVPGTGFKNPEDSFSNSINMTVVKNEEDEVRILIPDPELDCFLDSIAETFVNLGFSDNSFRFVRTFGPHRAHGEVHCGTNTLRKRPQ